MALLNSSRIFRFHVCVHGMYCEESFRECICWGQERFGKRKRVPAHQTVTSLSLTRPLFRRIRRFMCRTHGFRGQRRSLSTGTKGLTCRKACTSHCATYLAEEIATYGIQ